MHRIDYLTFSSRLMTKTIANECDKIAERNSDCGCGLYKPIRVLGKDRVFKDYEEAQSYIDEQDSGWYDNMMVKYKEGKSVKWLVKIEYHT